MARRFAGPQPPAAPSSWTFRVSEDDPALIAEFLRPDYDLDMSYWSKANTGATFTWKAWARQMRARFT